MEEDSGPRMGEGPTGDSKGPQGKEGSSMTGLLGKGRGFPGEPPLPHFPWLMPSGKPWVKLDTWPLGVSYDSDIVSWGGGKNLKWGASTHGPGDQDSGLLLDSPGVWF